MRTPLTVWRLSTLTLLIVLAGCFKLSRDTPRVQHFVLSGAKPSSIAADTATGTPTASPSTPNGAGLALGLRRIDLASYLAVPSIVMRRGANEIVVSQFHRWGEDLGDGINRAVAAQLASTAPVRSVDVAPWTARARHDFVVQLHVSRFEGVADSAAISGRSHMAAAWDIIRPLDGRVLMRGSTESLDGPWRVGDYGALVTALDAALAKVARDIRSCLARFPNDSTPPSRCESAAENR